MSIFHSKEFCELHGIELHGGMPWKKSDIWKSPGIGTFGGFLHNDFDSMENSLTLAHALLEGPKEIKMAPQSHNPIHANRSISVLDKYGYRVLYADINYDIVVDEKPLVTRMVSGHRKKLNKCERSGFEFTELAKEKWGSAYALLEDDRKRKGRKLSMSFDDIHRQEYVLPDVCKVFGIVDMFGKLQSAAICMNIKEDILYVWAWGDTGPSEFAPTIMLASGIYEYSQRENISILDVGISTECGMPNHGLMQFKSNLGFKQSLKFTMYHG